MKEVRYKNRTMWTGVLMPDDFRPFGELKRVLVYGSNTEGKNGKGTALFAQYHLNAKYGVSMGYNGNAYALCTKNLNHKRHPSVPSEVISWQISVLYERAKNQSHIKFIIPYTPGPNLNGYSALAMAAMFWGDFDAIPPNIIFNKEFIENYINRKA